MEVLKQILQFFPEALISGIILSFSLISITYFLVWKKYKARFTRWRIQLKQRVDNAQLVFEIENALLVFVVGASISSIVLYFSSKGYTKIYSHFADHNPVFGFASFFILLFIDDAWFYWVHRLLHHPKLFPLVHVVHHRSVDVNPFTSMSFHWLEPFLLTCWIFPVSFLIPICAPVLAMVQLWGLLDNIKSHLGYEFYPASFNRGFLRFMTTSTHHNMHHSKFKGNYGVHFRFWDRLLGTEFPDYEQEFDRVRQRDQTAVEELPAP